MSILLDCIVAVLFIVTCITGYVMGFFKYAALMLKTVVTLLVAGLAAYMFAAPAYDTVARDKAVKAVEERIEKIDVISRMDTDLHELGLPQSVSSEDIRSVVLQDGDVVENFNKLLEGKKVDPSARQELSDKFETYLDGELYGKVIRLSQEDDEKDDSNFVKLGVKKSREEFVKLVKILVAADKHAAAQQVEESYIRPVGVKIAGAVIFLIVSVAVSVILVIVIKVAGLLSKIKVVCAANSFGGLALGAAKGALYVLVLAYALCAVVNASHNNLDELNTGIVDKTYLFKHFFNIFYK